MKFILLFGTLCLFLSSAAQRETDSAATKNLLDSINRLIDRSVVKKDTVALQKLYAGDFYFLHATGMVDSKTSWLRSVSNPANVMASREHDSVQVELHGNVALIAGTLSVRFPSGTRKAYAVRYIRLYAVRNAGWQLLSHRSTGEWHLED